MRLEAGRLLGKQGTPLLPLGEANWGEWDTQRGFFEGRAHSSIPFSIHFCITEETSALYVGDRPPLHLLVATPAREESSIGFCALRLSLEIPLPIML